MSLLNKALDSALLSTTGRPSIIGEILTELQAVNACGACRAPIIPE